MPKIDFANVEVIRRLVYPEPFYRETEGYEGQRVGNAAGLTQFGVNRAVLPPRRAHRAASLARGGGRVCHRGVWRGGVAR